MGGGLHSNERRAFVKVNRIRCSGKKTGWEEQKWDRLRTEQCPGVLHSGGLESDGVAGKGGKMTLYTRA